MSKKHTITEDQVIKILDRYHVVDITFSCGEGSNKSLDALIYVNPSDKLQQGKIVYKVKSRDEYRLHNSLTNAVTEYNELD